MKITGLENLAREERREFVELFRMRPFEMTTEQKQRWNYFASKVNPQDISIPLTYRRIGIIKSRNGENYAIKWENGLTEEVPLQKASQLRNYPIGQTFEAQATYHGRDFETLLRLTKVKSCKPVKMTREEAKKFWDRLPTTTLK